MEESRVAASFSSEEHDPPVSEVRLCYVFFGVEVYMLYGIIHKFMDFFSDCVLVLPYLFIYHIVVEHRIFYLSLEARLKYTWQKLQKFYIIRACYVECMLTSECR